MISQSWDLILFRHQSRRYVEHFVWVWDLSCSQWIGNCSGIFPMNTADSNFTFFSISCNIWNSFVFSASDHSPDSRMILILKTIPILFHRFHWRNFGVLPLLEKWYCEVALSITKCFFVPYGLHSSVDKNFLVTRSNFSYLLPRSFIRSPIASTSQYHLSTLEKTKHDRHPTLCNLLKRSFP